MGSWGYKVNENDDALDVLVDVAKDDFYMGEILKKEDFGDADYVLCAIAVLDTQFNGIDERIWSEPIFKDEEFKNALVDLKKEEPRIGYIPLALYKLDFIKEAYQSWSWKNSEDRDKRNEIIGLLKERLELASAKYAYLRKTLEEK